MHKTKMKVTENFIYLSQIDSKDIFVYSHDAIPTLQWLFENGYEVLSWEAFQDTKNGITRTLHFGRSVDSPFRCLGKGAAEMEKEIELTVEDWSKNSENSKLIICLNLKSELPSKVSVLSKWTRIAAGVLGIICIGVLGIEVFFLIGVEKPLEGFDWVGPVSALLCAPVFLYASFTGKGEIPFLKSEEFFKKRTKKRIKTENGQLRWPQNA